MDIVRWRLNAPFVTSRDRYDHIDALRVTVRGADGHRGRGEALGVDYAGETAASMRDQLLELRAGRGLDPRLDREGLYDLLPAGGARNALDAALWDLEAKRSGIPAWRRAGVTPRPVTTAVTISLDDASAVERAARALGRQPVIKIKVDATRHLELVAAVRRQAPAAALIVDANEAWSVDLLGRLAPDLAALGVALIEQPLPAGRDSELRGATFAVALAADESCTDRTSLDAIAGCYQVLNIKLDKTGGLTEALALARDARARGYRLMVGNMCGSSLAMAPAMLLAVDCEFVDLDGPLLQLDDVPAPIEFNDGRMSFPTPALWG